MNCFRKNLKQYMTMCGGEWEVVAIIFVMPGALPLTGRRLSRQRQSSGCPLSSPATRTCAE